MTERDFWLLVYRGIMLIAKAVKDFKVDIPPPDNQISATPETAPPINKPPENGALVSQ